MSRGGFKCSVTLLKKEPTSFSFLQVGPTSEKEEEDGWGQRRIKLARETVFLHLQQQEEEEEQSFWMVTNNSTNQDNLEPINSSIVLNNWTGLKETTNSVNCCKGMSPESGFTGQLLEPFVFQNGKVGHVMTPNS